MMRSARWLKERSSGLGGWAVVLGASLALVACAGDGSGRPAPSSGSGGVTTGGTSSGAPTVEVETPARPLNASGLIVYAIADDESRDADVLVEYSADGGQTWAEATPDPSVSGHEGTRALSSSPLGAKHGFGWNVEADLGFVNAVDVRVRVTADSGQVGDPGASDPFGVVIAGRQDPDCDFDTSLDNLVLTADYRGGFVPVYYWTNHITHTKVYGDGKVVFIDPARGFREIRQGWLTEDEIVLLLKHVAEAGFWGWQDHYQGWMMPTDLPSAFIGAKLRGGREKTVSAYGGPASAPPAYEVLFRLLRFPELQPADVESYLRVDISSWELQNGQYQGEEFEKKLETPTDWIWVAGGGSNGRGLWREP